MTNNETTKHNLTQHTTDDTMTQLSQIPLTLCNIIQLFRNEAVMYLEVYNKQHKLDFDVLQKYFNEWKSLVGHMALLKYYPSLPQQDVDLIQQVESTMCLSGDWDWADTTVHCGMCVGRELSWIKAVRSMRHELTNPKEHTNTSFNNLILEYLAITTYGEMGTLLPTSMARPLMETIVKNRVHLKKQGIGDFCLEMNQYCQFPPVIKGFCESINGNLPNLFQEDIESL